MDILFIFRQLFHRACPAGSHVVTRQPISSRQLPNTALSAMFTIRASTNKISLLIRVRFKWAVQPQSYSPFWTKIFGCVYSVTMHGAQTVMPRRLIRVESLDYNGAKTVRPIWQAFLTEKRTWQLYQLSYRDVLKVELQKKEVLDRSVSYQMIFNCSIKERNGTCIPLTDSWFKMKLFFTN